MPKQRTDAGTKRVKYNNHSEKRGITGKEVIVIKAFWKKHTMDQIIALSPEELEATLDKFYELYEQRQLSRNRFWDWPVLETKTMNEIRNKKMPGVDRFNR